MAHRKHSFLISYPISLGEKIYSIFFGPFLIIFSLFLLLRNFNILPGDFSGISYGDLGTATLFTLWRLLTAYILAILAAIPLAIMTTRSPAAMRVLLPALDILESIPVLAFFPILIIVFLKFNFVNGAAIFILFLSMLWNIVFTVVGGLQLIPKDIVFAARVFKIRGWRYIREIVLPAVFPEIVTGSILAFAQGWNIIIVAEVIHVYLPNGTEGQDLWGLGSILVHSIANGQNDIFMASIVLMVFVIGVFNFFIWQKLIHYAERFKFE